MSPALRPCLALVLAVLAVGGGVDRARADEQLGERIEVRIVDVDVVVTGRREVPVSGLGRDDFEVLIDGRPAAIRNFFAVDVPPGGAPPGDAPPVV